MAETLGSLCDKLTIVELKTWHSSEPQRLASLASQRTLLAREIDDLVRAAARGEIETAKLTFASNKVYDVGAQQLADADGSIGQLVAGLAHKNCELWHEQERVYEVQKSPASQHDAVDLVGRLGRLNLERTKLIDAIDRAFVASLCTEKACS